MSPGERAILLREYERLRKARHELHVQTVTIDQRLAELEFLLPDRYDDSRDVLLDEE